MSLPPATRLRGREWSSWQLTVTTSTASVKWLSNGQRLCNSLPDSKILSTGILQARYFFYLNGAFSGPGLLKPLCVSAIVLLPLLGTLQATSELEAIQVASFCVLALQNGFFWRVVFEQAQAKLKG